MKKLTTLVSTVVLGLSAASCGGDTEDAAKALAAFKNDGQASMRARARAMKQDMADRAEEFRSNALLAARLHDARLLASSRTETCTNTDNGDGTYEIDCSYTFAEDTYSCGDTTYTFKDGTGSIAGDFDFNTGAFEFSMQVATSFMGGDVEDFVTISCEMGISGNMTEAVEVGCENFSCTIDGDDVDCEDMQEDFTDAGSCA